MADVLTSIEHLKTHLGAHGNMKGLIRQATLICRIDSLLEDMNVDSIPLDVQFRLNDHREPMCFHPSALGSTTGKSLCGKYPMGCSRALFYDYVGESSTSSIDPRTRRIFDTGSAIHAQLQSYLFEISKRSGGTETFTPEAHFSPKNNEAADQYDMAGATDGIYCITDGRIDLRIGVEIKSINDSGYGKTSSPHPEHMMQATVYQKCLDLPLMLFLYYNKNDSSLAEFVHIFDERRWDAIARKIDYVREHAVRGEEPEREDGWHCKFCKYHGPCNPPARSRAIPTVSASSFKAKRKTNA